MLICVVVERTVTRCGAKLKAPVVKQNSFEWSGKENDFPTRFSNPTGKGDQWTILLCLGRKNGATAGFKIAAGCRRQPALW